MESKRHTITIETRSRTLVTGVEKVEDSSPALVNLTTTEGPLTIKGDGLHIRAFSAETGDLTLEGRVDKTEYHSGRKPALRRIFG